MYASNQYYNHFRIAQNCIKKHKNNPIYFTSPSAHLSTLILTVRVYLLPSSFINKIKELVHRYIIGAKKDKRYTPFPDLAFDLVAVKGMGGDATVQQNSS